MTATELSPDELIRSAAFFDAAVFAEIVEQHDNDLPCQIRTCESTAELRVLCAACRGLQGLCCAECYEEKCVEGEGKKFHCRRCFTSTRGWRNATAAVPL